MRAAGMAMGLGRMLVGARMLALVVMLGRRAVRLSRLLVMLCGFVMGLFSHVSSPLVLGASRRAHRADNGRLLAEVAASAHA